MKNLIFTIYYILLTISVFSQVTYSNIYNVAFSGLRIISNSTNNYIFYSTKKNASTHYLNRNIFITDSLGESIDTIIIEIPNHNMYGTNKVIKLSNVLVFSGSIAYNNHLSGFVLFSDNNYNVDSIKIIGGTIGNTYTFLSFDNACILTSEAMMFCGEEYDTTTTSGSKIQLTKTDSAGNRIWKKNYSFKSNNRAWFIEPTPDGGALIGGNSFYGATLQGQLRTYDAIVLKVDSAGNEQWHKIWGNPNLNDDWAVVQNSGDGNYIIGTAYAEFDTVMNNYTDYSARTINIIKLDTSSNEIWNKKYLQPQMHRTLSRMLVLDNGNIACVGWYRDLTQFRYSTAWILMLNPNGDSLWYHEYVHKIISNDTENSLRDIKPTPDGGYICCGEFSDGLNGIPQSLWVLKLDSTGWYYGMGFGASAPLSPLRKLKVFPNPTSDFITVDISNITQYKNLSLHLTNSELKELEVVSVDRNSNSVKIDLRNYPSGVYFIRLQSGVEILGVEKVVKN